ncbi:PREDICTED: enoyl-CoA hydratase domain-containing protein 3, mitochondrial isoform X2 [Ceratosolen solmsi marchali]|uniref:Enoyl-CoA hydratase domain-containing protein 3, mitochondrial n=1 Tax=Ceratosolen solmsi marchali TaxID=326594 RepID=A0AAJ7E0N5_9HYME|nr:PREDICTED: enoyl-CoA hydratase domain-containing protein 3, mitochondrial isoform X2 [Ceratosolen solmsi marchali]
MLQVGRSITRTLTTARTWLGQWQEKHVNTQQTNGVRRIRLNHVKTRNSLSLEMMHAILQCLTTDSEDLSLRSIVITAESGTIFSAGHNLKELISSYGEEHHRAIFDTCGQLMKAISECPVPVIAAVDGLATAAGCQLVAACDIVVGTERSSFSTPGVNFGIFCSTPGIPLIRNVPKKVAAHMLFTGLPISAVEAYQAGLVSKIVPIDMLEQEINKITDAINQKSRSVIQLGKQFIKKQLEMDIDKAYSLGTEIMVKNLKLKDAQEGIKSFTEKRKPSWNHNYDEVF